MTRYVAAVLGAAVTVIVTSLVSAQTPAAPSAGAAPLADHHQHLFSPTLAALVSPPLPAEPIPSLTARDLIAYLDAAGIKRAALLSVAYSFGNPARMAEDEYAKVKAENDWNAEQAAQFPDRLIAFCGLNPLKDYALAELARCAADPRLRNGLKLHFGNSVVDYHNPQHIRQVQAVFRAANGYRMPMVIHMRSSISQRVAYGRVEAAIFLNQLVPAAPDVVIQIAHLAGAGGYADPLVDQALSVFVEAIEKKDPRAARLYFDVTAVALPGLKEPDLVVTRIRQIGVQRILYGSDAAGPTNQPREGWANFRKLPLTDAEFAMIAANIPPYMR
jgi:uncharacterized protein